MKLTPPVARAGDANVAAIRVLFNRRVSQVADAVCHRVWQQKSRSSGANKTTHAAADQHTGLLTDFDFAAAHRLLESSIFCCVAQ